MLTSLALIFLVGLSLAAIFGRLKLPRLGGYVLLILFYRTGTSRTLDDYILLRNTRFPDWSAVYPHASS